jgi:adenine-specific DNA-methyltransferase
MYPRLLLARDLLADNGVTFISIGKDEVANLRILCDSVMGEDNLVGIISRVMKSGGGKGQFFSPNIDYILVYARNVSSLTKFRTPVSKKTIKSYYKNMETEGERAGELYGEERIYVAGLDARPNQRYWIECPDGSFVIPEGVAMPDRIEDGCQVTPLDGDGCWKWTYESYLREKKDGNIVFKQTSSSPLFDENGNQSKYNLYNKVWLSDKEGSVPGDYLSQFENRLSSSELKKIDIPFDFAKPTALISYLIDLCTSKDEDGFFVVDFFSGSASTAHAVMNMNAENDTNIKFIMIQLPEPVKKNSKEEKAGFKTIDQIGQERIIRAAKKIKEEYPETTADFGFKHYTLQDVSQSTLDKMESFDNSGFVTNTTVYDEFGANTVLTTWLVHDGYGFSNNMEMVDLAGYTAYWCRNHLYFINPGMAEDSIKALIEKYNSQGNFNPQNIILFGYSFNYVEMENLKANVKILRDSEKNLKINLDIRY